MWKCLGWPKMWPAVILGLSAKIWEVMMNLFLDRSGETAFSCSLCHWHMNISICNWNHCTTFWVQFWAITFGSRWLSSYSPCHIAEVGMPAYAELKQHTKLEKIVYSLTGLAKIRKTMKRKGNISLLKIYLNLVTREHFYSYLMICHLHFTSNCITSLDFWICRCCLPF